ncbi:MAG: type III pantothenate kinase [Chitinophagaceae bacterium]|jgi:type III pantothenate kinase|nr:type III pantothenate kinase [Chitinophagaceae bacterium]
MKTLCLDFGNTRMKVAIFENGNLLDSFVLNGDGIDQIKGLLQEHQPEKSILSSVIHHDPAINELLHSNTSFHQLNHLTKLNFTVPVGKPETVGADRLALSAAVVHFYPGKNNLVVGLGSCITYNFINKYNQFLGGSISPGLEMRFRALHEQTALLPLIEKDWNFPLIGYDTKTNLLSGVIMGMAKEIEGIVEEYEKKYSNFNVVLTGGDCTYFERLLKKKIFADPNLLYKGLYAISETNS